MMPVFSFFFTEGELYPLTDTILNTVNNVKKYIQMSIIATIIVGRM